MYALHCSNICKKIRSVKKEIFPNNISRQKEMVNLSSTFRYKTQWVLYIPSQDWDIPEIHTYIAINIASVLDMLRIYEVVLIRSSYSIYSSPQLPTDQSCKASFTDLQSVYCFVTTETLCSIALMNAVISRLHNDMVTHLTLCQVQELAGHGAHLVHLDSYNIF